MERVALVTGADTGIGWAIAQRLQRDGFALAFHTHDDGDESRSRYDEIAAGGRAHWLVGDLGDREVPERLVREAVDALGRIDVLVNNAGVTSAGPALEFTADDFDQIFSIDVRGAFLLSVAAAKWMRGHGGGAIVNNTSVHEHRPRNGFALYSSAKAALGMLTRQLALELAPDGIRVNAVAPGAIATERNEEADEVGDSVPLGRPGEPEEVAGLVSFLASDASGYVTGASVLVDGGFAQTSTAQPAT
jgi:glucose 1-dehydrogenase